MADLRRLYTVWPARSKFVCFGRCMTGPCLSGSMLVWLLILVPVAMFCILILPKTWELQPVMAIIAIFLFASMIALLLATSCSEPGVIPKRAVIQALGIGEEISEILGYNALGIGEPTRDCLVDAKQMLTEELQKKGYNWCRTCEIVRPPRASHCRSCDHCVLVFDHHCPFVNNCVAKRNYFYFVGFLISILCSTLFGLSVVLWWSVNQASEFDVRLRHGEFVNIGASLESYKCVSYLTPVVCDSDAGGKEKRLNAYLVDDTFNITTHGTQVCAQRTDLNTGWQLNLQIACKKVAPEVLVVGAHSSEDSVIFGASWMVALVSCVVLIFLVYHLYLAYYGMTSKEQQTSKPTRTDLLLKKVKKNTLFTARGPSLFDPHALVRVDVLAEAFQIAKEMRKVAIAAKAAAAKQQREEEEELMADPEKVASLKERRPAEADRLIRLQRRRAHAEKLRKEARQDQCCLTEPRPLIQGVKSKFRRLMYRYDKGWCLPRFCGGADQAIVHIEV